MKIWPDFMKIGEFSMEDEVKEVVEKSLKSGRRAVQKIDIVQCSLTREMK